MAITKTLMVALWCLIAVGIGLIGSTQAQEPSVTVTRSINPDSVPADVQRPELYRVGPLFQKESWAEISAYVA